MTDLSRLEAQVENLQALQELFAAMQALAASRAQAAQTALPSVRLYTEELERAIGDAARLPGVTPSGDDGAWGGASEPQGALVALCSEHGFVGGLNRQVLEATRDALGPDDRLLILGRRGAALAAEHGLAPETTLPMATRVDGAPGVARALAGALGEVERVRIVHARRGAQGQLDVAARLVLPPPAEILTPKGGLAPPLVQLDPAVLMRKLLGELLLAELVRAVMEAFGSESLARLRILQSADQSISTKIERLDGRLRAFRQSATTNEILEVVAAAEAFEEPVE